LAAALSERIPKPAGDLNPSQQPERRGSPMNRQNSSPSGLRLIPRPTWFLAAATLILIPLAFHAGILHNHADKHGSLIFSSGFVLLCGILASGYVLVAGYIYGDARRRGMNFIAWTVAAVMIPNLIGFLLYFVLRAPILLPCPQCGRGTALQAAFCSACGHGLPI
jgi:hypothetical protein